MTTAERRNQIVALLKEKNFLKSTDFVKHFAVSGETIRRDLDYLQNENIVQRVYGGAILAPDQSGTPAHNARLRQEDIDAIGKAAANLILPGETVFLDVGTTVLSIARHLKNRADITVITASVYVINELIDADVRLITLGGIVGPMDGDIHGDLTMECAKFFYCNKVFFGCNGITPELGVMDYCSGIMTAHRQFYHRTDKYILVTDSGKFGKTSTMSVCPTSNLDMIITDSGLSDTYRQSFADMGVEMMVVDPATDELV